jgi:hypothetical protein
MRTFPLHNGEGQVFAFEVENIVVSVRELARLVKRHLGAKITFGPKSLGEVPLRFVHAGVEFEVWEPFGDNSRFWVGPAGRAPERVEELDDVHRMIQSYQPSLGRRILSALGF